MAEEATEGSDDAMGIWGWLGPYGDSGFSCSSDCCVPGDYWA